MKLTSTDPQAVRTSVGDGNYVSTRGPTTYMSARPPCNRVEAITFAEQWTGQPTEDAAIMAEVVRLEAHWRDDLTEPQRETWRAWWELNPPRDIFGRAYRTRAPLVPDDVQVSEPRVYAWQNIYGTYRLGLAPVDEPTEPSDVRVRAYVASATPENAWLTLAGAVPTATERGTLLWMTTGQQRPSRAQPWRLRYIGQVLRTAAEQNVPVGIPDEKRWRWPVGSWVCATAGNVDINNSIQWAGWCDFAQVTEE